MMLVAERQSAQMLKITNDGLTYSDTGCYKVVSIWQQWASKGYSGVRTNKKNFAITEQ